MATRNLPFALYLPVGEPVNSWTADAKMTVAGADFIRYSNNGGSGYMWVRSDRRPPSIADVAPGFSHPDLTEWLIYMASDDDSLTLDEAREVAET